MPDSIVRFLKSQPPYSAGERAGFPTEKAEQLVRGGVAEYADKPTPAEKQKSEKAPKIKKGSLVKLFVEGVGDVQGRVEWIKGEDAGVTTDSDAYEAKLKELTLLQEEPD